MKKLLSALLCAVMLLGTAPAVISGEDNAKFVLDENAPAKIVDDHLVIDESVSVSEVLSYFKNRQDLYVCATLEVEGHVITTSARGDTEKVSAIDVVTNGDAKLPIALCGDANSDGRINARDLIALLKKIAGKDSSIFEATADIDGSGTINVKDVITLIKKIVGHSVQTGENARIEASGNENIEVYFDSLMHRVGMSDTTIYGSAAGLIRMAKNELEDAQLYVVSHEQFDGASLEVGEMKNDAGDVLDVTVRSEQYWDQTLFVDLVVDYLQDASNQVSDRFCEALPLLYDSFNLGKEESLGFVIQVKTTADTVPGYYSAPVVVKDADGNVLKETVLRTLVWNVTLDDNTASETAFGFNWETIIEKITKNYQDYSHLTKPKQEIFAEYMAFFMENRISPYHLPVDVLSPEADAYMSDPRVTSFCVDGGGQYRGVSTKSDAEIIAIYDKLSQNPDWLHKAYVYLVDEPSTLHTHESKLVYDRMTALVGSKGIEWHQATPMGGNDPYTDEDGVLTDSNDYTYRYADIMVPQSRAFSPFYTRAERKAATAAGIRLYMPGACIEVWDTNDIYNMFGQKKWQQRYDEYIEQGLRPWWYICCSPMLPHPNYFRYYQGAAQRVTLWQQYMFHCDGLLYWAMQNDWTNGLNLKRIPNDGDGLLMYWGELFGQSGPVPSIRFEFIRDGIEDFQYMKQLQALGTNRDDIIHDYVNRVTTEILRYSEDYHDIENTRVDLGFALEKASEGRVEK